MFLPGKIVSNAAFLIVLFLVALIDVAEAQQPAPVKRPNVLMIVADDMNWDSPGCFGGTVEAITPNIDRLASEGMRFWYAHVNVAVCTLYLIVGITRSN
jgi:N-sulfoglucosamine sulfohydrolase